MLRAKLITHRQLVLVDALLWSCRGKGRGEASASYSALQRLTRMARSTIAEGLRVLQRLRVLTIVKRRVRLVWHQGGARSLQAVSIYILHPTTAPHTESNHWTVSQGDRIEILTVQPSNTAIRAAQDALKRRCAAVEAKLALLGVA